MNILQLPISADPFLDARLVIVKDFSLSSQHDAIESFSDASDVLHYEIRTSWTNSWADDFIQYFSVPFGTIVREELHRVTERLNALKLAKGISLMWDIEEHLTTLIEDFLAQTLDRNKVSAGIDQILQKDWYGSEQYRTSWHIKRWYSELQKEIAEKADCLVAPLLNSLGWESIFKRTISRVAGEFQCVAKFNPMIPWVIDCSSTYLVPQTDCHYHILATT